MERKCRELAIALNLPLAEIDRRRTLVGEWYCFEVNPSPGFTDDEQMTGAPIARAIARLLTRGETAIRPPRPPALLNKERMH